MSIKDGPVGRSIRSVKAWMSRVTHDVTSNGNTEARRPGERRFGPADRRLAVRAEPTDRRHMDRRDG